jgi:predicted site-specific integrase-resolvase
MTTPTPPAPVWLGSLAEIGDYARQSRRTIQRWIAKGDLRVRRLSAKSIICKTSDVDAAIRAIATRFEEAAQ